MSHYETLRVPRDATPEQIKSAHRKLARKHHPDKNPGDEGATARYQTIQRAYDILSDPESRQRYDETGSDNAPPSLDVCARNTMVKIWQHYVISANPGVRPLPYMRESLVASIQGAEQNLRRFNSVASHRGKLRMKTDNNENLFECVLDEMQKNAELQRPKVESDLKAFRRALEILADYESTESSGSSWITVRGFSTGTST